MNAKIQLSAEELELVQDAGWLLTKNKVIDKVFALFGEVAHNVRDIVLPTSVLPDEVLAVSPKISKGENYKGLPYVMLDYPRLFGKEDIFAIRVMFWWGNFISITLHLKGKYKEQYVPAIVQKLSLLQQHHFAVSISDDEWRHEFEEDNYRLLSAYDSPAIEKILSANAFCKLSSKIPLQRWNEASKLLEELYKVILNSISI